MGPAVCQAQVAPHFGLRPLQGFGERTVTLTVAHLMMKGYGDLNTMPCLILPKEGMMTQALGQKELHSLCYFQNSLLM